MAEEYQALIEQLTADSAAVQHLGSPIVVQEDCHPGSSADDRVWLTPTARDPQGEACVRAVGFPLSR